MFQELCCGQPPTETKPTFDHEIKLPKGLTSTSIIGASLLWYGFLCFPLIIVGLELD
jgi:hypothetical protein